MSKGGTTLRGVAVEDWLSARELAAHFGLKEDSAYRWVKDRTVPTEFVWRGRGRRKRIRIRPDALPALEEVFAQAHE